MNYAEAAELCACIAKDHAGGFFRLLANYKDISAQEAASWTGVQLSEAEGFLESLTEHGIVEKKAVDEREVAQSRYSLRQQKIQISINISSDYKHLSHIGKDRLVLRRDNASSELVLAKSGDRYRSVTIWKGMGRGRVKREIWLTPAQGKFLYFTPISESDPIPIQKVIEKAAVGNEREMEILLLVEELDHLNVIQVL